MEENEFVVLGMHKSGTTLIADILHRSGIPMVETVPAGSYDDGNKMERSATRALNMELLRDEGVESLRLVRKLDPDGVTQAQRNRAALLCREAFEAASDGAWGFKDPRTLLTYEFWLEILEHPRLIGVFRSPIEVFQHYVKRAGRRWISRDPAYLPDALRSWCIYNRHLLAVKRQHPEMILFEYTHFLTSETSLMQLAEFVGRPVVDCRELSMRRAKPDRTMDYRLARQIVRIRDGIDPDKIYSELCRMSQPMTLHQK